MGRQTKKKTRSFSLTDEEFERIEMRQALHGFDRNAYLLALEDADRRLGLVVRLDHGNQKILDLPEPLRMAAEKDQATYGTSKKSFKRQLLEEGKAVLAAKGRGGAKGLGRT